LSIILNLRSRICPLADVMKHNDLQPGQAAKPLKDLYRKLRGAPC
jgi:hypothetical protein